MIAPAPYASLLGTAETLLVAAYAVCQLVLLVYASHRWSVLWRLRRAPGAPPIPPDPPAWPRVTVQLPVYNERLVVTRLIDAVAALDYPRDRLEIQVLDDSTDDTRVHAAAAVARHRARGVNVRHVRREAREGYKAGALAHGLARARGDLLAVFDADFVPEPDFLRRTVPWFQHPDVGLVQARWGHLNRGRSLLTAAQAVQLDAHFLLEHEVRHRAGLFFNFNGTAGVWRRDCIVAAGGWTHDTLTEDLDLSYRAQLAGWRFVFAPDVSAPAELPSAIGALKSQQRRWARGSIQTARKLLPALWRAPLPWRVKAEATLHLTANVSYAALLAVALLLPAVLALPGRLPWGVAAALHVTVLAFGVAPVLLFLAAGQRRACGRAHPRDVLAALALGIGLAVNNTRAVVAGLTGRLGDWERTPKTGEGRAAPSLPRYVTSHGVPCVAELGLAVWFATVAVVAAREGERAAIPFLALLVLSFGAVARAGWRKAA